MSCSKSCYDLLVGIQWLCKFILGSGNVCVGNVICDDACQYRCNLVGVLTGLFEFIDIRFDWLWWLKEE